MNKVELMKFFNFDETDLAVNRTGVLSQKQLQNYAQANKIIRIIAVVCGLFLAGVALIFPIFMIAPIWELRNEPVFMLPFLLPMLLASLIWVLVWGLFGAWVVRKLLTIQPAPVLDKAEGKVRVAGSKRSSSGHSGTYTAYVLHVGRKRFEVDDEVKDWITNGESCIVYFIKSTDNIVSVEQIPQED